jgi:hypothetical protein
MWAHLLKVGEYYEWAYCHSLMRYCRWLRLGPIAFPGRAADALRWAHLHLLLQLLMASLLAHYPSDRHCQLLAMGPLHLLLLLPMASL